MKTLLIATTNEGKLGELRAMLAQVPVRLIGTGDCGSIPPPDETAPTFMGNAEAKAIYYAQATGHDTLADDSGLEVDALDGEPGVRSARYAGSEGDDRANNEKLIRALARVPAERRTARFRCAMALARNGSILARATGTIEGRIVDEPRGSNGFGYDPHFFVEGLGLTTAEMPPELKNRLSHRGRALAAMIPQIERILTDGAS